MSKVIIIKGRSMGRSTFIESTPSGEYWPYALYSRYLLNKRLVVVLKLRSMDLTLRHQSDLALGIFDMMSVIKFSCAEHW